MTEETRKFLNDEELERVAGGSGRVEITCQKCGLVFSGASYREAQRELVIHSIHEHEQEWSSSE